MNSGDSRHESLAENSESESSESSQSEDEGENPESLADHPAGYNSCSDNDGSESPDDQI